jgi:hypothetical protein
LPLTEQSQEGLPEQAGLLPRNSLLLHPATNYHPRHQPSGEHQSSRHVCLQLPVLCKVHFSVYRDPDKSKRNWSMVSGTHNRKCDCSYYFPIFVHVELPELLQVDFRSCLVCIYGFCANHRTDCFNPSFSKQR